MTLSIKSLSVVALLATCALSVAAQDEGTIVKRDRIANDKGIFFAIGPSATLGKNIGDYSAGFNIEAGFLKRLNRILSVGPSLSFVKFKYDPEVTNEDLKNTYIGGPYRDNQGFSFYEGLYFDLKGGDISITSLSVNLKLNVVPVRDNSKFSVYGFAKPFLAYASRDEVTGVAEYSTNYGDITDPDDWYKVQDLDWESGAVYGEIEPTNKLEKESKVTGGIFIGPGVEFAPAKKVSAFFQVSIGYTFPISYVSTEQYNAKENRNNLQNFIDTGDINKYPMYEKGFPSVSLQLGAAYNF